MSFRIGHGFDAHRFATGRPLWLGGVCIPHARGLAGHSDGDVLLHSVADALLGALGRGDLGAHFPGTPEFKGIASAEIVRRVFAQVRAQGFALCNLDATVVAEAPRLSPHQSAMRANVAALLQAPPGRINIKVTGSDGLGALGREEGIAAHAVLLLEAEAQTQRGPQKA